LICNSALISSGKIFHIAAATLAACKSFHFLTVSSIHSINIFHQAITSFIEILSKNLVAKLHLKSFCKSSEALVLNVFQVSQLGLNQ
jgi:hypothetical protein